MERPRLSVDDGATHEHQEPLATAVFAGNVAVISSTEAVMSLLAWQNGLPSAPPPPGEHGSSWCPSSSPRAIFLAPIPVAYVVSSSAPPGCDPAGADVP